MIFLISSYLTHLLRSYFFSHLIDIISLSRSTISPLSLSSHQPLSLLSDFSTLSLTPHLSHIYIFSISYLTSLSLLSHLTPQIAPITPFLLFLFYLTYLLSPLFPLYYLSLSRDLNSFSDPSPITPLSLLSHLCLSLSLSLMSQFSPLSLSLLSRSCLMYLLPFSFPPLALISLIPPIYLSLSSSLLFSLSYFSTFFPPSLMPYLSLTHITLHSLLSHRSPVSMFSSLCLISRLF